MVSGDADIPYCRLNIDCDLLKTEANKRLKGDIEAENPGSKKKKASVRYNCNAIMIILSLY